MNIGTRNYTLNNTNKQKNAPNFKALPTKVCGFCYKEDVSAVLGAAAYQKNPHLILGLLINLKHFALKGLSLNDKKAGELLRAIREGSFQRNTQVRVACVNHELQADELLGHVKSIYETTFSGKNGLAALARKIAHGFAVDKSKLLRGFDIVQIHDNMPLAEIEKFAQGFESATHDVFVAPRPKIVKAVHVPKKGDAFNLKDLREYALEYANLSSVDGLILDSSNLATDQIGGTGLVNDWKIARDVIREIHKKTGKPVGLAGGLCPSNIDDAIKAVKPDFIDGNTGFRFDRADQQSDKKWRALYPGTCPPKDSVAVNEVLKVTADLPSSSYFDKHLS